MTGTVTTKKFKNSTYYYIRISYKNPKDMKWKTKWVATGLLAVTGNKRKANAMLPSALEEYSYLERQTDFQNDILLSEYIDRWLQDKKNDVRQSTYESYEYRANAIKKYFDGKQLVQISPRMINDFFKYCRQYGKINQKTGEREPLAVRSIRSYSSILFAVYTQAVIDNLVTINPVAGLHVQGKKNKEYQEDYLFLKEDEISELLHFLNAHDQYKRLVPIAFVGVYFGLRRSEILGLKWSAINFDNKTLTVNHTIVRVKTVNKADSTKTNASKRTLNLFPTAESCFKNLLQEQEKNRAFFRSSYQNKDGYVFTWEDGRLYDPDYISKLFCRATREFGRPEITLHKLRHTCASLLLNKGWDIKKLQYWLGHEDSAVTLDIYSHFNKQRLNTSVNDLSEISLAASDLF